ncbi:MAG: hypothetical protein NUV52_01810 [Candidatus Roizmanbacteria bacterium]|nr:hypothetical protein [Candidatus Roizmanbacteria bacterium]
MTGVLLVLFVVLLLVQFGVARSLMRIAQEKHALLSGLFDIRGSALYENGRQIMEQTDPDTDARRRALTEFFTRYDSPLLPYVDTIIKVSDREGIHYGLLPAIAMVESGVCKKIPKDSHNCWGWGIYGTKVTRFSSYGEAIDTVARGLKRDYINNGMTSPAEIMRSYNPSNHNNWAENVQHFLDYF